MRVVYTAKAAEEFVRGRSVMKITLALVKGELPRMSTIMHICEQALNKSGRYETFNEYAETHGEHSFCVVESAEAWLKGGRDDDI